MAQAIAGIERTVTLNNGVEMPWLGLGTWRAKGDDAQHAILAALELGYRSIDTAAVYENEEDVGRALRDSGVPREQLFVTTKLWNTDRGARTTGRAFDKSLKRLGLEYVDLYLIHWPGRKSRESWKVLEQIHRDGRARAIGVSNFLKHHLEDLLADADVVPAVDQIEFHPELQQRDTVAFCRDRGIQPEAWSPLIQGRAFELPELEAIARRHGKTVAQVVLRWDLQKNVVTIPKSVNPDRIRENAELFDFELSDDEVATLDGLERGGRVGPDPDRFGF